MTDVTTRPKKHNLKSMFVGGVLIFGVAVGLGYSLSDTQTLILNNKSTAVIEVKVYGHNWIIDPKSDFQTRFKPEGDGSYSIIDVAKSEEITQVGYLTKGMKSCYNIEIVDANEGPGVIAGGC